MGQLDVSGGNLALGTPKVIMGVLTSLFLVCVQIVHKYDPFLNNISHMDSDSPWVPMSSCALIHRPAASWIK